MSRRAIGGYFGLSIDAGTRLPWLDSGTCVQSGRVALALALPDTPKVLWVPAYFCPPVAAALGARGWTIRPYALGSDAGPSDDVSPSTGDRVLAVDYFGLTPAAVRNAVARFGADTVIADHSLALYSPPVHGIPTVYSPRKFVALPDGGVLANVDAVAVGPADEARSAWRSRHLLLRACGDVQGGRGPYAEAEASLEEDVAPRAMSALTRALLGAADLVGSAERRKRNYDRLAEGLRALGYRPMDRGQDAVPLCCPVPGLDPARARPALADEGIFCAGYWPGLHLPGDDHVGRQWAEQTTFLPCDQRYDDADIDFMLERIDAHKDRQ